MSLSNLFRILREEAGADGAAGGAGTEGAVAGAAAGLLGDAAAKAAAESKSADGGKADDKPVRPDDIPEQFWDKDKGAVRADALTKAWKDTRKELELAKKSHVKAPEKAEDYKFEVPADAPIKVDGKDPALAVFRNVAHAAGLSQDQYAAILGGFLNGMKEYAPEASPAVDIAAEKAKLGPNADAIAKAVLSWGKNQVTTGLWSQEEFEEVVVMGSTAAGLRALDKLRVHMGEKPIPVNASELSGLPSKEELYAKVADPKYSTDPSFRAKVDKEFEAVFGTDPSGTSERGLGVRTNRAA